MKAKMNPKRKGGTGSAKSRPAPAVGRRLIASLTTLRDALQSGEPLNQRFTVRTVHIPADPNPYDSAAVRRTREKLGASQAVFAKLVGVSTVLAQSWEQGSRRPSKLACRLLDEINADVDRWRRRIA